MKIYFTEIKGIDPQRAKYPPTGNHPASALGMSLLAAAYEDYNGEGPTHLGSLPRLKRLLGGKPVFEENPNLHFSISHSRTHVICVLSDHPVGVDTLDFRPLKETTINALATPEELEHFTIYELWALRESVFKLTGTGDLRTMRFTRSDGKIIPPQENVHCRLYLDLDNSSTAVASMQGDFPDHILKIPTKSLLKSDGLLTR